MIIAASCLMFTPVGMVTWMDVGGGCYRAVLEHGSTLRLMGGVYWSCMHVSCMCVSYT